MLHLTHPYNLTVEETTIVAAIKAEKSKGTERWEDCRANILKHHISVHTLNEQNGLCAYCESLLQKGGISIDHIAPKGKYPDFVFETMNLVTSCNVCNGSGRKGQTDTISNPINPIYVKNTFLYVHPRLDNPDDHIVFFDADRTIFDLARCSKKGLYTIEMMGWGTLNSYHIRIGNAGIRNLPRDIASLIREISVYQP